MKTMIYTVHAYRWGDRECHSYAVGVFGKKTAALKASETEEEYRGGKYECEVLEWVLDASIAGNHDSAAKVIKTLPPLNTLKAHKMVKPFCADCGKRNFAGSIHTCTPPIAASTKDIP